LEKKRVSCLTDAKNVAPVRGVKRSTTVEKRHPPVKGENRRNGSSKKKGRKIVVALRMT